MMSAAASVVPVGALACQKNPFLASLKTRVISVTSVAPDPKQQQQQQQLKQFEVILSDTCCFPTGGGQPHDLGTITLLSSDDKPLSKFDVVNCERRGNTAVHLVVSAGSSDDVPLLKEGDAVEISIDMARRRDHMQHHTAQHLLTSVLETFNSKWPTESWSLSHPTCFVQLPVATIEDRMVQSIEDKCNELIAAGTPVSVITFASRNEVPESRSRGIPLDVTGPVRLVDISNVDTCTCCGTHVPSLAHLGALKILHQEPKGNTLKLHFVVGDRLRAMFGATYSRERALVKHYGVQAQELLSASETRSKALAVALKSEKKLKDELATLLAPAVVQQASASSSSSASSPVTSAANGGETGGGGAAAAAAAASSGTSIFTFHREDADMDMLGVLLDALVKSGVTARRICILAGGSLKGGKDAECGAFVVAGPSEAAVKTCVDTKLIPELGATAKGSIIKGVYRGKAELAQGWKNFVKKAK